MFSCQNCEEKLTEGDKKELGIGSNVDTSEMTRLKAIVIDGTAAGILKQLPKYGRDQHTLDGTIISSKRKTLLHSKKNISPVKDLCNYVLSATRRGTRKAGTSVSRMLSFWITTPPPFGNFKQSKGLSAMSLDIIRLLNSSLNFICKTLDESMMEH